VLRSLARTSESLKVEHLVADFFDHHDVLRVQRLFPLLVPAGRTLNKRPLHRLEGLVLDVYWHLCLLNAESGAKRNSVFVLSAVWRDAEDLLALTVLQRLRVGGCVFRALKGGLSIAVGLFDEALT